MITSNNFSILITTRTNDIKRLEICIDRIRKFYPNVEIVIVYDKIKSCLNYYNKTNIIEIETEDRVYVSGGYNIALKYSTKPLFIFWHDDTFMTKGFIEYLIPNITEKQFCNFTQIEPPVYNKNSILGKPIQDLGRDIKSFDPNKLDIFYENYLMSLKQKTIPSPYGGFFMSGYKDSILNVGGFDTSFQPYFFEDADLMMRLILSGYSFIHSLEACAYHMGSLTSRSNKTEEAEAHYITSQIFTKKWGVSFDSFKHYCIDNNVRYKRIFAKIFIEHKHLNYDLTKIIENHFYCPKDFDQYSTIKVSLDTIQDSDLAILSTIPYYVGENKFPLDQTFNIGNLELYISSTSIQDSEYTIK